MNGSGRKIVLGLGNILNSDEGLANIRGKLSPHLHMVGVQPADLSIGLELNPAAAMLQMIQ